MSGLMGHPPIFYGKVAGMCFVVGGMMETFMIRTGFYDKVTELEADRLEETREDKQQFLLQLRQEIEKQAAAKHVVVHFPDDETPKGVK